MTLVFRTAFQMEHLESRPIQSLSSASEETSPLLSRSDYQEISSAEILAKGRDGEALSLFKFLSRMAAKLTGQLKFLAATQTVPVPLADRSVDSAFFDADVELRAPPGSGLSGRRLRPYFRPSTIHFWAHYITWDGIVDEVVNLENREVVFGEWWENSIQRVYYRLDTKAGRQLWLFRTAEGDFVHGEFE